MRKKLWRSTRPYRGLAALLIFIIIGVILSVNWYYYEKDWKAYLVSLEKTPTVSAETAPNWQKNQPLSEQMKYFCKDSAAQNFNLLEYLETVSANANPEAKKIIDKQKKDIFRSNEIFAESYGILDKYCPADKACNAITIGIYRKLEKAQILKDNAIKCLTELDSDRFYPEEEIKSDVEKLKLLRT